MSLTISERGLRVGLRRNFWPVTLDGLDLGVVDDEGIDWLITDFEGWASKPEAQAEMTDRTRTDGAIRGTGRYAAKSMSLTLAPEAPDPDARLRAEDRLKAALSARHAVTMVVHEEVPRQMQVWADGETSVDRTDGNAIRFAAQVQMVATDPHKYGTVLQRAETGLPRLAEGGAQWPLTWPATWTGQEASGVLSVTNDGNDNAPVALRVYGPAPWIVLEAAGRRLTISNPDGTTLRAGQWLDIDAEHHQLDYMGRVVNGWASGQWPVFGPGVTDVRFASFNVNTEALLVAEWRDTWI